MAKKDDAKQATTKRALNERLREILAGEMEQLPATLEALPPQERIKAIIELLPYVAPKLKPAQAENDAPTGWEWPTF
jgi:hypothetical protein